MASPPVHAPGIFWNVPGMDPSGPASSRKKPVIRPALISLKVGTYHPRYKYWGTRQELEHKELTLCELFVVAKDNSLGGKQIGEGAKGNK